MNRVAILYGAVPLMSAGSTFFIILVSNPSVDVQNSLYSLVAVAQVGAGIFSCAFGFLLGKSTKEEFVLNSIVIILILSLAVLSLIFIINSILVDYLIGFTLAANALLSCVILLNTFRGNGLVSAYTSLFPNLSMLVAEVLFESQVKKLAELTYLFTIISASIFLSLILYITMQRKKSEAQCLSDKKNNDWRSICSALLISSAASVYGLFPLVLCAGSEQWKTVVIFDKIFYIFLSVMNAHYLGGRFLKNHFGDISKVNELTVKAYLICIPIASVAAMTGWFGDVSLYQLMICMTSSLFMWINAPFIRNLQNNGLNVKSKDLLLLFLSVSFLGGYFASIDYLALIVILHFLSLTTYGYVLRKLNISVERRRLPK